MLRHCVRRASRGCVDAGFLSEASEEDGEAVRRESVKPGAEGAPRSVVLVVVVGCEAEGAMRRDCGQRGLDG